MAAVTGLGALVAFVRGAFLNAAGQFVLHAFRKLQVVVREPCEFLFPFSPGNVPVSLGCKCAHKNFLFGCVVSTARLDAA
jgi:hypothetical protein